MAQQHVKIAIIPASWMRGPRAFEPAGYSVTAHSSAIGITPTKALFGEIAALRFWPKRTGITIAVTFANSVTTSGECNGLLIVHRHPRECQSHVRSGAQWIWLAADALGIDINEAHLDRG